MNELPAPIALLLFKLSLHICVKNSGSLSNRFDALFPEFNYWDARTTQLATRGAIDYDAAAASYIPENLTQELFRLGYPDLACRAQTFLREHQLL